jgi:hypothetical protein
MGEMQMHISTRGNKLENLAAKKLVQKHALEGLYRPAERLHLDRHKAWEYYTDRLGAAQANFGRRGIFRVRNQRHDAARRHDHGPKPIRGPADLAALPTHTVPRSRLRPEIGMYESTSKYLTQPVPLEGIRNPTRPPSLGRKGKKRAREEDP